MNIINVIKNFFKKIKNKNLLEISEKTERNLDKLIIFDWGGVIESHSEGEYNLYKVIENILKRFNIDLESEENLGKRYVKFLEPLINDSKSGTGKFSKHLMIAFRNGIILFYGNYRVLFF